MLDTMIRYYYDYFMNDSNDGFRLLYSSVCVQLLSELYRRFLSEGIPSIETLPQTQKEKYWNHAIKYHTEPRKRIKACEAAYVLELITSQTGKDV